VNLPGLGLGLSIPFHPAPAKVSKIVILKLAKINQRKNKKMNKERGESLGVHCCHELGAIDRSMWTGHKCARLMLMRSLRGPYTYVYAC